MFGKVFENLLASNSKRSNLFLSVGFLFAILCCLVEIVNLLQGDSLLTIHGVITYVCVCIYVYMCVCVCMCASHISPQKNHICMETSTLLQQYVSMCLFQQIFSVIYPCQNSGYCYCSWFLKELNSKIQLLRLQHTCVIEHEEIRLAQTQNFHPYVLVFTSD